MIELNAGSSNFVEINLEHIWQPTVPPTYITYIAGHYNPSVRIMEIVSNTTYVVRVNFIHKWRNLQFNIDSKRLFEKLFMTISVDSQSFCQQSAERKSPQKYFSYFCFDVWPGT